MIEDSQKIYLNWDDTQDLVDQLCKKIPIDLPNIDSVTGIERGGLIPAVMISHTLDLPYVQAIKPNTLVVDDIADSGETLENTVGVYTATLVYKPHTSSHTPNIWAMEYIKDKWINFPWEKHTSTPIQDYLK